MNTKKLFGFRATRPLAGTIVGLGLTALSAFAQSVYTPYIFTTLAGKPYPAAAGSADGTNGAALFAAPNGLAVDSAGNVYVPDQNNNTIRKLTPVGTNWVVTTLAGLAGSHGTNDGTGSDARFNFPDGVAVDSANNVYVTDYMNNTIRKVTPVGTNWVVTTLAGLALHPGFADGTNSAAQFNGPGGVAVDSAGDLYVADGNNNAILKLTLVGTNWVVTTLAGLANHAGELDRTGSAARFNVPGGVALDGAGNLYVPDQNGNTIRKLVPVATNWVVTTLAGRANSAAAKTGWGATHGLIFLTASQWTARTMSM